MRVAVPRLKAYSSISTDYLLADITKKLLLISVRKYLSVKAPIIEKPVNWFHLFLYDTSFYWKVFPNRLPISVF